MSKTKPTKTSKNIEKMALNFEETSQLLNQRNAELAVINSVQEGLAAEMDMQGVYDLVGNRLRNLFDAQVTGIYSFDHNAGLEHFHYLFEDGERLYPESRPLNEIRKWMIKNKSLLLVNKDADNDIYNITDSINSVVPGTRTPKSMLFVPLMVGSQVKGCVSLQNLDRENAFSDSDVRLLSTLANSMSVALENARLFNETEQRNAELAVINSVQEGLVAEMDMQGIYDLVGDKIRELFDAQVAGIATFNFENNTEEFQYVFEDGGRFYPESRPIDRLRSILIEQKKVIYFNENIAEKELALTGEEIPEVPGTKNPQSYLLVPLIVGDRVKGYVTLQNLDRENAFSDSDVRLLSTLANSMSVALENARLFNETEQRNAELAVINSVQEGLVAEMDMQGIYDLVGDKIRNLFDAQVVAMCTFNYEHRTEEFKYIFEDGERFNMEPRPIDKVRQKLIDTKELICINENADEEWTKITGEAPTVIPGTKLTKSALFVPMIVGSEVRGYVSLQNLDREHAFSDSDVRLLSTLANSMSVALENARLFNETEQRNAELAVINSVQEGLVAEMDMQGIYDLVGNKTKELFDSQVTIIATFDHENHKESFNYFFEDGKRFFPEPRTFDNIRQSLIETQKLIHIQENATEAFKIFGVDDEAVPGTKLPKTMLYVPLIIGDTVRGYVSLQNLDKEHAFSESDVRLLNTLANSMSVALENARLFNETEQRNAELAVINSVQEGLVAEMDMQGIYDLVGDKTKELFDSQVTIIATFDHENHKEHFNYLFEEGKRFYPEARGFDNVRQRLIETQKLIHIQENAVDALKKLGADTKAVPGTKLPKTMLYVPLIIGDTVRGYVSLQNLDKEHAFSDSDVRLLSTLANSMSVALENARLFNETEQRNAELAVINSVQEGLVAEMDMQGIYDLVGDKTRELFDAQVAIIASFNHENKTEFFNYLFEDGKRVHPQPRPFDKIRQRLITTKKLINFNENVKQAYTKITGKAPAAVPGTKFPKSVLFVPLIIGDTVRGYVSLQNIDKENAFSDSDVRLLSTLANSMSVALENARLFNETEQRNAELAVINSVQEGLVAEMDMQGIYDLVGDKTKELFDAQVAVIATFNHENNTEFFNYLFEDGKRVHPQPRPFDKIRKRLISTKKLININENAEQFYTKITGKLPTAVPGTKFPKSMLYVPLIIGDTVRGYVSLQNLDKENAFSDSDVRLLSTLANSMSVALENARLFNETEQRNAELAVINSVQEGLVAEMDMQGIYDLVGDKIRDLFDAQVTGIVTFNNIDNTEHFRYLFEDGKRYFPDIRPYDKVREKIIEDRKTLLVNENASFVLSKILGQPHKPVPGTRVAKSAIYVPMVVGKNVPGYVTLQNLDKENAFSESDVSLLNTLVNSMTVALENARLFNETTRLLAETEQRNTEFAVINSVQEGLVGEMEDMHAIYLLVASRICEVLNIGTLLIRTFDHDKGLEHWEYAIENGKQLFSEPRPFIWANKHLIKTKEPLLINENYLETAQKYGGKSSGVSKGLPPKSAIFVPMIVGDMVMGSVSLQNVEKENAFTESDVRLLNTLTNSMSVAIQNARLFNETTRLLSETEQRATELQTVNNISIAMVSLLEFDALIKLVGDQMQETFKADIVYLALHDLKSNMLHFPYIYGETAESRPFANGMTEKIITTKKPLLINQKMDEAVDKINAELVGIKVQSYLGVPIIAGSKALGVISVQSTETENVFDEYDQRLLTTIAANLGIAIQNAEAYQKLQAALTELKATQQQLIQSEKMASLGELTAGIAHEIQNPLNFVNNFSEVNKELLDEMIEELKNGNLDDVKEIANDVVENEVKINHHGQRASSIVKGMLQHSRSSTGKKEPTNINVLADEYLRLAYHGLRAKDKSFNATLITDFDKSIGNINVIPQDIGRVILNLFTNAFYVVNEKRQLNDKDYEPTVTLITKKTENFVSITVIDNGNGIPEKVMDKIFQPFFTTKPTGQGTGLGLSMSYDIITKGHGGELDVKTTPNIGTEFKIVLPIDNN